MERAIARRKTRQPSKGVLKTLDKEFTYDPLTGIVIHTTKSGDRKIKTGTEIKGFQMKVWHMAWYLHTDEWPITTIEHIDRNNKNNKWSNLQYPIVGVAKWKGDTKKCRDCGEYKPSVDFYANKYSLDGFSGACRECDRERTQQYRDANRAHHNEQARGYQQKQRAERAELVKQLKDVPCAICGNLLPKELMDFDHVDPKTKEFNITDQIGRSCSLERFMAEVAKCRVLCCYCHVRETNKAYSPNKNGFLHKRNEMIDELKQGPCTICGGCFEPYMMHFDHIDPSTKSGAVSDLKSREWKVVLAEIAKCQLLCIGCHRLKTSEER